MVAGDVKELLARLTAGGASRKTLISSSVDFGLIENRPWNWALPENVTPDGVDLFLLPLEFEFAGFLLPVFEAWTVSHPPAPVRRTSAPEA